MMPSALFISPHLDDVAFSCAEPVAALRSAGWRVIVATVFTATVEAPGGFALACQLDKGLAPEVDYMALRRAEDRAFAASLDVEVRHLDLAEAPHRGYDSVEALFGRLRNNDPAIDAVPCELQQLLDATAPTVCFAPVGIGGHVDHALVVASMARLSDRPPLLRYADQPYACEHPVQVDIAIRALAARRLSFASRPAIRRRAITAIEAYASQLDFQFGGAAAMHATLEPLFAEGTPLWHQGAPIKALEPFVPSTQPV